MLPGELIGWGWLAQKAGCTFATHPMSRLVATVTATSVIRTGAESRGREGAQMLFAQSPSPLISHG